MDCFDAGVACLPALLVCALVACGTEYVPPADNARDGGPSADGPPGSSSPSSGGDAGGGDAGGTDAGGTPPGDGGEASDAPVALTPCEEAPQHSDLAWLQQHVFTPSCAVAGCHAGTSPGVGLSLEVGKAYANLVNRGSSTVTGWIRVVPGQPAQSYLLVALGRAAGPPPRDGFMPIGGLPPLCVEMVDAVERWVGAGALP